MDEQKILKHDQLYRAMNQALREFCQLKTKESQQRYWQAENEYMAFLAELAHMPFDPPHVIKVE